MFQSTIRRFLPRAFLRASALWHLKPTTKFASFFLASSFFYNFTHNRYFVKNATDPTPPEMFITDEDYDDGPADWSTDGKRIMTVCVTGAGGALSLAFLPLLLDGSVFGPNVRIRLRLLDLPEKKQGLYGLAMELEDSIYPLLENIKIGSDPKKLFKHCDLVIGLAGLPRKRGASRMDLLKTNGHIYKEHGQALNEVGKRDVRFVVVANPANTNTLILQQNAPNIPAQNFTCATRIDQNRAVAQLAFKANILPRDIQNVVAWGNHSNTIYPDVNNGKLEGKPIRSVITDDKYLDEEFVESIQKRGDEILSYREHPSVLSGANALKDHIRDWWHGTEPSNWVSMGVVSDGSYNVPKGLVFSFPVVTKYFRYNIVRELELDDLSKKRLNIAIQELTKEREEASKYE